MAWVDNLTTARNIVQTLATVLTTSNKDSNGVLIPGQNWTLMYPETLDVILNSCILKTTTTPVNGKSLTMYLKINRPTADTNFQYIEVSTSDLYTAGGDTFPANAKVSPVAKWYWYVGNPSSTTTSLLGLDLAIHYYGSVNNDRVALVLEGDGTIDYNEYLTSFGYIGRILSFTEGKDDIDGNFAVTVSSWSNGSITPPTTYGEKTANGMTDISMFKSRTGVPYQRHYPAIIQTSDSLIVDPYGYQASLWTDKYHLSPIYVVHEHDGYRGYLDGVVAVPKNNIVHRDTFLVKHPDATEDTYKYFNISVDTSIFGALSNKKMNISYDRDDNMHISETITLACGCAIIMK